MNKYLYLANYGIAVSALTISIIGLILTLTVHYSDKRYRKYFVLIFTFLMAYSISNVTVWVVSENHGQLYATISYIGRWVKVDKTKVLFYHSGSRDGAARIYACGVSRLRG